MPAKKKSKSKGVNMNIDVSGCKDCHHCKSWKGGMGCGYGLGFIGAAVYYIQTATGFWSGVLGVLKAIVWPAFLVHKLLGM